MSHSFVVRTLALSLTIGALLAADPKGTAGKKQSSVEARLQQLEDGEQIRDLLAEYIRCLDSRDHATYALLFAKDGELTFAQGHAIGPEAIRKLMEDGERRTDPARAAAMAGSVHLLTDLSIQLKGDEATAHSRWTLIVHAGENRPVVSASGHYSDALVRENGAWKFKRREIVADLYAQASAANSTGAAGPAKR
jgi:SnoaL-like domain